MIFGLYEPENERKVQLDLVIDRNDPAMQYRRNQEEIRIQIVDLTESQNFKE